MRFLVIVSLLFSMTSSHFYNVDEYRVIKVNGQIIYKKTGKDMSTGDVFKSDLPLLFKTESSHAAIISKIKGRFVLSQANTGSKTNLVPAVNNMSSRAGAIINELDVKNHFVGKYLILNEVKVDISPKAYAQDATHFFFLQYDYNGEKIMKKLGNVGNKLVLNEEEIFTIDGNRVETINTEMTLYYRDATEKKNMFISKFEPVFPNSEELALELDVILQEFEGEDDARKMTEVKSYLNEFYGKPQDENVKEWLDAQSDK
jgi:hypothetical protein